MRARTHVALADTLTHTPSLPPPTDVVRLINTQCDTTPARRQMFVLAMSEMLLRSDQVDSMLSAVIQEFAAPKAGLFGRSARHAAGPQLSSTARFGGAAHTADSLSAAEVSTTMIRRKSVMLSDVQSDRRTPTAVVAAMTTWLQQLLEHSVDVARWSELDIGGVASTDAADAAPTLESPTSRLRRSVRSVCKKARGRREEAWRRMRLRMLAFVGSVPKHASVAKVDAVVCALKRVVDTEHVPRVVQRLLTKSEQDMVRARMGRVLQFNPANPTGEPAAARARGTPLGPHPLACASALPPAPFVRARP